MKTEETKVEFTLPIFWGLWMNTGIMNPLCKLIQTEKERETDWEYFDGTMNGFRILLWGVASSMVTLGVIMPNQAPKVFLCFGLATIWIAAYSCYRVKYVNPLKVFESKVTTFFIRFCGGVIDSEFLWNPVEQIEKVLVQQALMPGEPKVIAANIKVMMDHALSIGYMDGDSDRVHTRILGELVPKARKQWGP